MKKLLFLILAPILFTCLMYDKDPGLNFTLCFLMIDALIIYISDLNKMGRLLLSLGSILLSFSSFYYFDAYSNGALVLWTMSISFLTSFPLKYLFFAPFIYLFNGLISGIRIFIFSHWMPDIELGGNWREKIVSYIIIPLIILITFIIVYTFVDTNFSNLFTIRTSLDLIQIVVIYIFFFAFLFNLLYLYLPDRFYEFVDHLNENYTNVKFSIDQNDFLGLDTSSWKRSGEVAFTVLNLTILVLLVFYNQFDGGEVIRTLSEQLHAKVNTIIMSISMAILLVMFYFKGELDFMENAKYFRTQVYIWIFLNTILVFSAAYRNYLYIHEYGLTGKRIFVLAFLFLCIIGLAITVLKLVLKKTNFYIINKMSYACLISILVGSLINWSWVITNYNLSFSRQIDLKYLSNLSYNHKLLDEYFTENHISTAVEMDDYSYFSNRTHLLSKIGYYEWNKKYTDQ